VPKAAFLQAEEAARKALPKRGEAREALRKTLRKRPEVLEGSKALILRAVAKQAGRGVVMITTTKPTAGGEVAETPRQPRRPFRMRGAEPSSGFLVSPTGLIVTASYVVKDADKIMVQLNDGKEFEAKPLGADPISQVAVLKIEGENFPFLRLGDSSEAKVGQLVICVGCPFGLGWSVTHGIVMAVGVHPSRTAAFCDYIHHDAAVNPGNEGGPLVNMRGEVIGVNLGIVARPAGNEHVAIAVPVNVVKVVKDQIATSGKTVYSYLGVATQELDRELADSLGLGDSRGVLVDRVIAGTPADEAGLAKGDIILEMDGKPVADTVSLGRKVAFTPPGTQVTLTILRKGQRKKADVKLRARPTGD
jgi:serine protease Do